MCLWVSFIRSKLLLLLPPRPDLAEEDFFLLGDITWEDSIWKLVLSICPASCIVTLIHCLGGMILFYRPLVGASHWTAPRKQHRARINTTNRSPCNNDKTHHHRRAGHAGGYDCDKDAEQTEAEENGKQANFNKGQGDNHRGNVILSILANKL